MVAAAIIFLGAGSGVIASTVNPFSTGVASDAAGITIGDGIGLRIAMWFVLVSLAIGFVIWYARRVRAHPEKSVVGVSPSDAADAEKLMSDVPVLTGRQKLILVLFAGTFLLMIYGFIPWNDLWQEGFGKNFPLPTFGDFYFPEAATLFLVMAVVIGLIARLGEEGTVTTIVAGAADFLGAGLIIVLARGITVVMKNAYMTDTVLHWMEKAVSGRSQGAFGILAFIVNLPIAVLVPSSSGQAALVMPILAPLADFAGVSARRRRDGVPVGLRARQPRHADIGGDHGRARPLEGRLRPLPEVRLALRPRRLSDLLRVHRHLGGRRVTLRKETE